jgi:hypothetical protein
MISFCLYRQESRKSGDSSIVTGGRVNRGKRVMRQHSFVTKQEGDILLDAASRPDD